MPPLGVGSILKNRYRISKILHQSKLTNVYVVDDIHLQGNIWAVKEMKFLAMDNIERQKIISQFQQEVTKMTELSHPNLARVIDFFVDGQNLYVIREFIPAYDVGTLMKKTAGMLRERDVVSWGVQLADVLAYLFSRKFPAVFFRELILANILINSDGGVSLIDMGLARAFQMETDPNKLSTLGCMDYASPEQFDEHGVFDQRTLVYNLGAILFHMLTKKNPAQCLFNLPPIEDINPEISRATRAIIKKATEVEPRQRYQTLADMKRDLKNALRHPDVNYIEMENKPKNKKPSINWNYFALALIFLLIGGIFYLVYKIFFI